MQQYKIGDLVSHPIDKAAFEVVGIRKDEIEIKGDFSGGTHNVCQVDWVPISEVSPYTPPSDAEGQGEWINASKGIPDESNKRIKWRDANSHAEISTTAARSAIHTDQAEFVEWYKSHPAPSGPVEGIRSDFKEVTGFDTPAELTAYEKGLDHAEKTIMKFIKSWDGSTNSVMGEALAKHLKPTPVEADFETALEAECCKLPYTKLIDHHRVEGFEMGAKWARQYLDNPAPANGIWSFGCEVSPPPPESGCVNTVTQWITDGKTRIEIDDFDADLLDNGEVQLASFLNKYGYKLSIDDPSPLIISHLEEQIAHLKSQQAGPMWVRATERPPSDHKYKFVKIEGTMSMCRWRKDSQLFMDEDADFFPPDQVEWLDESDSPAPEQVDPVDFADWLVTDGHINPARGPMICMSELFEQYTASLQNK